MDFGSAALLIGTTFALTAFVLRLIPNVDSRVKQVVSFVIAVAVVYLVRETVWAHTQVIGDETLSQMDWASALLVGLVIGSGSNVLHKTFDVITNIGENRP